MIGLKPLYRGKRLPEFLQRNYPGFNPETEEYNNTFVIRSADLHPAGSFSLPEGTTLYPGTDGESFAVTINDREFLNLSAQLKSNSLETVWNLKDGRELDLSYLRIMGILNVTPDSFSDGGKYNSPEPALRHAVDMMNHGADIIDIGGLSTRPESIEIPVNEELSRILPVIRSVRAINNDILISADTYRHEVAEEALKAGADIINDISGGAFDPLIHDVTASYDAPYIMMHTPAKPAVMQKMTEYSDVIRTVYFYLQERGAEARKKGVTRIIADPGIGFGKTAEQNFEILSRLEELLYLGYPLLIGLSRKSFIGKTLDLETDKRDIPTSILEGYSVSGGARIIRTHNILHASYLKRLVNRILQY